LLSDNWCLFDISFLCVLIFKFKNCFDCYLHKILEAVSNELSMIDYFEKVTDEDLLCSNILVLAWVGEARVVLVAASEHRANWGCERNWQHQIVRSHKDCTREDAINLGLTRLILRLVYEFYWRGFQTCLWQLIYLKFHEQSAKGSLTLICDRLNNWSLACNRGLRRKLLLRRNNHFAHLNCV
jgi:hypothetical protein